MALGMFHHFSVTQLGAGLHPWKNVVVASSESYQSRWLLATGEHIQMPVGRRASIEEIGGRSHLATFAFGDDGVSLLDIKSDDTLVGRAFTSLHHTTDIRLAAGETGPVIYSSDGRDIVRWSVDINSARPERPTAPHGAIKVFFAKRSGRSVVVVVGDDGTIFINDAFPDSSERHRV